MPKTAVVEYTIELKARVEARTVDGAVVAALRICDHVKAIRDDLNRRVSRRYRIQVERTRVTTRCPIPKGG